MRDHVQHYLHLSSNGVFRSAPRSDLHLDDIEFRFGTNDKPQRDWKGTGAVFVCMCVCVWFCKEFQGAKHGPT